MLSKLKGWKTYISVLLIVAVAVLKHFEIVDESTYEMLVTILGAGAVASLRAGVNKAEEKAEVLKDVKSPNEKIS